jgi:hypothetical protein
MRNPRPALTDEEDQAKCLYTAKALDYGLYTVYYEDITNRLDVYAASFLVSERVIAQ